MTSKIKDNLLFYLSSTREKSRSIAIGHDSNLKNDLLIKLLIKNCSFKFDLMLIDEMRSKYKELKIDNIYSIFDISNESIDNFKLNIDEATNFDKQVDELKQKICNVHTESCLIVDSINLFIFNYDAIKLNHFINHLLNKYSKVIFLFNQDLVDQNYLIKIEELCTAFFELNRKTLHSNEIEVNYIYKKKCNKLGIDLIKGEYRFTFDSKTYSTKLIEENKTKKDCKSTSDNHSYDLSFNLSIKDEDEQRKHNVLPFMRAQKTSKVYYTPDKSDDVDEEDPDDDLLI